VNDIIPSTSSAESGDARAASVAGVHAFAVWLQANPQVAVPLRGRFLLPLHTNPAVADFATKYGLNVVTDEHGNTSCDLTFGPVTYHAYGYADFKAQCERDNEKNARQWAKSKGMEIVTAGGAR
jgi:hypothetical protein